MKSGIAAVAMIAALLVGSGAGYLVGTSAQRTVTSTAVSVTTASTILTHTVVETLTYRENAAAEGESLDAQGIELSISINSTTIRPNGTISITYGTFNVLSSPVNVTAASNWGVKGLVWPCGYQSWSTNDVGVMRGYYTLGNVTGGTFLNFWYPVMCPVDGVINSTGSLLGVFLNATSYSFLPVSDRANVSLCYTPINDSGLETGVIAKTVVGPYYLGGYSLTISATDSYRAGITEPSLLSSVPGAYTIVAADEWGNLVLLHFSVM